MDAKPHMLDSYSIKYEEKEVEKRATSLDTNLCKKKYAELGAIFEQVLKLKKDKSTKSISELKAKRNEASLMIVLLKKVNRLEKYRIRTGREVLQKEKLRVDNNRLHLQNLLYEISYLKKEIQRCYQFTSCDEYINLVPETEFYEKAPLSISRPEATKVSEHIKRLAMLEWELQQRKELSLLCEDLVCRKDSEIKRIASTNERLESFGPSLSTLLKATKRLQTILGLDIEKEWEVNAIAKLLPQSLYMLYMKLSSFAQSFCPSVSVTVEGTEDDVRQYELIKGEDDFNEYDQNSDNEESDSKRKKHSNKTEQASKKKLNMEPFPLFIKFTISRSEEPKGNISIEIRYFPALGFVTAASNLNMESLPMTDVVSAENILNYLFEADSGNTNPSLNSKYQLHEMQANEVDCLKSIEDKKYGKPYKWVQKLCGMDIFQPELDAEIKSRVQTNVDKDISVGEIIKKIKAQWSSRLNLYKQLHQLENRNSNIFSKKMNFMNVSLSSTITQWSPITWEDFMQNNSQHMLCQSNFVKPGNLFYKACISRGNSKLECFISISPNFPTKSPIWLLSIPAEDASKNKTRNAALKDMEYWTNSLIQSQLKSKSSLLLSQMIRTLCSFDIFVETGVFQQKLPDFTQDKIMLRSRSKRNRGLPLKFVKNSIFKQF